MTYLCSIIIHNNNLIHDIMTTQITDAQMDSANEILDSLTKEERKKIFNKRNSILENRYNNIN